MNKTKLTILIVCTLFLFFLDVWIGSVLISFDELISAFVDSGKNQIIDSIVMSKRLPHTAMALVAGVGLSVSGLIMQTIFRNPLAGPFVLGVSSGASFGVAILLLGASSLSLGVPFAAVVGAMSVLSIISIFANKISSSSTILIIGLMLSYFVSAFTSFLISISTAEEIQSFSLWGLGSFSKVNASEVAILSSIVLVGCVLLFSLSQKLNIYLLGDQYAKSLGVDVVKLRITAVLIVGLIAGVLTAYCGPIAFVGMAVPHLSRAISSKSNHKTWIIYSVFVGAIFILIADIFCETPLYKNVIPINSITCLFGAPIVIWVLYKLKRD